MTCWRWCFSIEGMDCGYCCSFLGSLSNNANELHVACGIDPFPFRMLNTGPHLPPHHTTPHHTPLLIYHLEQSLLVEFDNKPTPLNRVDEDVAARESKVTPSADELDPASSDSLCEKCQSVYMLSKRKKKDLGYWRCVPCHLQGARRTIRCA
jgi:hypothetical protein